VYKTEEEFYFEAMDLYILFEQFSLWNFTNVPRNSSEVLKRSHKAGALKEKPTRISYSGRGFVIYDEN
jgi:hypothetical protein